MGNNKSIKKNYIYNLTYQVLALIIPFITTPYISRVLGASGVGDYSYTTAIVSYFVLVANLGSNYYGSRETAYIRDDIEKRSILFWEVLIFRVVSVFVCLVPYMIMAYYSRYRDIFFIQTICIITVIFDITWFFTGMEEFGVTVLRNTVVRILSVIFIFSFVKKPEDVAIYILGLTGTTFIGNLSFWLLISKYVKRVHALNLHPFRNFKVIIQLFIPYLATQIYSALDKVMIGWFSDTSIENGYYEQAEKIVKIVLTVVTTMGTVMVPRFAYLYKQEKWEEINIYLKKGFSFVWMTSIPLCLGIILISNSFVPWFFGNDFLFVRPLMKIFSLLIIAIGLSNLLGTQYLIPTGRQNLYTISVVIGAIVNVLLNLILIPRFFSYGAAIASVTAESCIAVIQICILSKEIPIKGLIRSAKNYIVSGLLMFLIAGGVAIYVPTTICGTFLIVFTGALTYVMVLLILKDSIILEFVYKVKDRIVVERR